MTAGDPKVGPPQRGYELLVLLSSLSTIMSPMALVEMPLRASAEGTVPLWSRAAIAPSIRLAPVCS
ncbi:MAG: hypothetical protein HKM89_12790, partial [Gemmatimonadales bacterium]|nr:hypothetical protein [Gemmatimonadales bacterium]